MNTHYELKSILNQNWRNPWLGQLLASWHVEIVWFCGGTVNPLAVRGGQVAIPQMEALQKLGFSVFGKPLGRNSSWRPVFLNTTLG